MRDLYARCPDRDEFSQASFSQQQVKQVRTTIDENRETFEPEREALMLTLSHSQLLLMLSGVFLVGTWVGGMMIVVVMLRAQLREGKSHQRVPRARVQTLTPRR